MKGTARNSLLGGGISWVNQGSDLLFGQEHRQLLLHLGQSQILEGVGANEFSGKEEPEESPQAREMIANAGS